MGISTIAKAVRGGAPRPARAYIIPLNIHDDDTPLEFQKRSLQYFPESLNDSKASNYQAKVIPGLSHPLYQWTSGGAREISFEATFSRDRSLSDAEKDGIKDLSGDATSRDLYASGPRYTQKASVSPFAFTSGHDERTIDIPSAIAWLRSFMDPEYTSDGIHPRSNNSRRPFPPRKMILGFPGVRMNWGNPSLPDHELYCIMTTCDAVYDAFFTDGTPRVAKVSLAFNEIIQVAGGIKVQDAYNRRTFGLRGYRLGKPKGK